MKRTFPFLWILLSLFCAATVKAQGCSDAGFCTLNSFKPNALDSVPETRNQIKVGGSFGAADHSISVFGGYLEYNRQIGNNFGLDAKFTTLAQPIDSREAATSCCDFPIRSRRAVSNSHRVF